MNLKVLILLSGLLLACRSTGTQERKEISVSKAHTFLPVKYYKNIIIKTETPSSSGKIVDVPCELYSIFNNTNDTIFLMTTKSPEILQKSGFTRIYQQDFRYHHTGGHWSITTASSNVNSQSEIDSIYLKPGTAFIYFGGIAGKRDIDSLAFSIQVKIKRGSLFKDSIIRKHLVADKDNKLTEVQGKWSRE